MIDTNTTSQIIPDIARVVHDVLPGLSGQDCILTATGLYLLAKGLRKAIPDNWQTGNFGLALKHCALEVNPTKQQEQTQQVKV